MGKGAMSEVIKGEKVSRERKRRQDTGDQRESRREMGKGEKVSRERKRRQDTGDQRESRREMG